MGTWDRHWIALTCMLAACASSPGATPSGPGSPPPAPTAPKPVPPPHSSAPPPAPDPVQPAQRNASLLPETLDRAMIADGLLPIRDQVLSCGATWPSAEGQVKVRLQVAPDGRVVDARVTRSPHEGLGTCVADAMAKASFAPTRNGGAFSFPWEFPAASAPALPAPPPPTASCAQQAAYLQDYLHHLDAGDPAIAPPWPTGDKQRDRHIDELLKAFRAAIKPEEKGSHFLPLNLMNITPGELERLYARCPASLASLKKVDEVAPSERWAHWHQAIDGLTSCACRADLVTLRVFYYLIYRGPF